MDDHAISDTWFKRMRLARLSILWALVFCPNVSRADAEIDPALLGRALGFDLSYHRECVGPVPPTRGQMIFLTEYSASLLQFSKRFAGDDFLFEFIHSSVRTQFDCKEALTERDRYWGALLTRGLTKYCLVRAISDNTDLASCLHRDE
ncbi:MAG: hypothetical protein CML69_08645 [Rhodobacteraceae bacterium]|nr:hypothetical protein [Paracoccaceae bacterium]